MQLDNEPWKRVYDILLIVFELRICTQFLWSTIIVGLRFNNRKLTEWPRENSMKNSERISIFPPKTLKRGQLVENIQLCAEKAGAKTTQIDSN